jgi:photosystem II stability/assembly factor-like uncharacterized protein
VSRTTSDGPSAQASAEALAEEAEEVSVPATQAAEWGAAWSPRARVLLATLGEGVARAVRWGREWRVETVLPEEPVRSLALAADGAVWAGTQGRGVLRSADAGASWSAAGLDGRIVKSLAPSPQDAEVVYAGLKPAGVAVTRDGGAAWTELDGFRRIRGRRFWVSPAELPGTAYVQGLAVSPTDPDVVVAGIEFGAVVRSDDGGRSWSGHCAGAIRDCHSLVFHARDGDRAYEGGAGRRRPLAASRDGGRTWSSPEGAKLWYGWACAADPADPDVMYASAASGPGRAHSKGSARAAIYRSRGGGAWEPLAGGLPTPLDAFPYALLTDPSSPGHLYAGLSDGAVWFTPDHGDHWTRLPVTFPRVERTMIAIW